MAAVRLKCKLSEASVHAQMFYSLLRLRTHKYKYTLTSEEYYSLRQVYHGPPCPTGPCYPELCAVWHVFHSKNQANCLCMDRWRWKLCVWAWKHLEWMQAAVNPVLESFWTHYGSARHNCLRMQCEWKMQVMYHWSLTLQFTVTSCKSSSIFNYLLYTKYRCLCGEVGNWFDCGCSWRIEGCDPVCLLLFWCLNVTNQNVGWNHFNIIIKIKLHWIWAVASSCCPIKRQSENWPPQENSKWNAVTCWTHFTLHLSWLGTSQGMPGAKEPNLSHYGASGVMGRSFSQDKNHTRHF